MFSKVPCMHQILRIAGSCSPCSSTPCNLLKHVRCISQSCRHYQKIKHEEKKKRAQLLKRFPNDCDVGDDLPEHVFEGKRHHLTLRAYTWGVAAHGALGRKSFVSPRKGESLVECRKNPHRLHFAEIHQVIDVSCGYGFTAFAVNTQDKSSLFGTGLNVDGQIGYHTSRGGKHVIRSLPEPTPIVLKLHTKEKVTNVSCGRAHTLALSNGGSVFCLGNNAYGQCGRSIVTREDYNKPSTGARLDGIDGRVVQVEAGQDTSFFVTNEGGLYSCGFGADGQTGRGHYGNEAVVGRVEGDLESVTVTKVACRADCVLALSADGDVFGWGNNEYQQLASATNEPQLHTPRRLLLTPVIGKVVDLAASGTACFVLNDRGDVYSWGFGLLGRGPNASFCPEPQIIPPPLLGRNAITPDSKVTSLACGPHMAACVTNTGEVFTWGRNVGGSLGLGHRQEQSFPIKVCLLGHVKKISLGVDHCTVLAKQL